MNMSRALVLGGMAALTTAGIAAADATSGQGQPNRLVGTWQIAAQPVNCITKLPLPVPAFQALIVFHAGGTSTEAAVSAIPRTPGFGNWSRIGHDRYTNAAIVLAGDANGLPNGTLVIRREVTLAADGETLTADTTTVITDGSGNVMTRCGLGQGTRFR